MLNKKNYRLKSVYLFKFNVFYNKVFIFEVDKGLNVRLYIPVSITKANNFLNYLNSYHFRF